MNSTTKQESNDSSLKIWQKRRYMIAAWLFFGFFNIYALRVNLSIAIVAMTENKCITFENNTVCDSRDFEWDSREQGFILSAFFYGYILTQFAGGWLAAKYGGSRIFGIGLVVTSVLTILSPFAAKHSLYMLVFVRVLEGIFEGVTYPCNIAIWSRWAPPLERSRLVSISFSGCFLGIIVSMPASAYISNALGWESIFYIFGGIGVVWYIGWLFIVTESPFDDLHIKTEELEYLKLTLGKSSHRETITHPWKSIIKSPAVWAITAAHFTENWGYYTLLTQLPKFMKDVLNFDLENAGIGSAIPYFVMGVTLQLAGYFADWLQLKNVFTLTTIRKMFTCCAFLSQIIFMLTAVYLLSPIGSTACISVAVGLGGFAWAGFLVNYLDIAPQHASVLIGIGNTLSTLPGILSPIVGGYIVVTPTANEWRIVFFIASSIYLGGTVIYSIFGTGEVQEWALEKPKINDSNNSNNNIKELY